MSIGPSSPSPTQPVCGIYILRLLGARLARDQAEARQVAVAHVQSHGLDNAFDDVLLPALEQARRDRVRAGLTAVWSRGIPGAGATFSSPGRARRVARKPARTPLG